MSDEPTQIEVQLEMLDRLSEIVEILTELKDAMVESNRELAAAAWALDDPRDMQ